MGIEPVTYYTATCDHCGESLLDGADYSAWSEDGAALDVVRDGDSTVLERADRTLLIVCDGCASGYWGELGDEDWDALHDSEPEAVAKFETWLAANQPS